MSVRFGILVWSLVLVACGAPERPGATGSDAGRPADDTASHTATDSAGADSTSPDGAGTVAPLTIAPVGAVTTKRVATAGTCASCHSNAPGAAAMRDAAARPIAPWNLWSGTMMANAARDPLWRAVVAAEVHNNPGAKAAIEAKCLRCHTPLAHIEADLTQSGPPKMAWLERDDALGSLARDGVSCTSCHRIAPDTLGTPASFTGNYVVKADAKIHGPFANPFSHPMEMHTGFTPTEGKHMTEAALCASCHTLYTDELEANGQPTGHRLPEQTPYLEWRASAYSTEVAQPSPMAATCQGCHVPRRDVDGLLVTTRIARRPNGGDFPSISPRSPYGRHVFVGGNTLVPTILRKHRDNLAPDVSDLAFDAVLAATRAQLSQGTASLTLSKPTVQVEAGVSRLMVNAKVTQQTGHKLPTGYPARRVWLELVVRDASGQVLVASGRWDERGRLLDSKGLIQPFELVGGPVAPHRDVVDHPDQVALWQAVMATSGGAPTWRLMRAGRYAKDNRLLPLGWQAKHPAAKEIQPVGVGGDTDFGAGGDTVHLRLPLPAGRKPATVEAWLRYQPLSARFAAELFAVKVKEVEQFRALYEDVQPTPETLAHAVAVL